MGRNGSGKSTLLWALAGALRRRAGTVSVSGRDPAELSPRHAASSIALVPQQSGDLLYHDSVAAECQVADLAAGAYAGATRDLFESLEGGTTVADAAHPRDLSDGQRMALALAVQLVSRPRVLLLDEPTRGLDYSAKSRLGGQLAELAAGGTAVIVASHDVEFVARTASRVVVLAQGEVIADAATDEALAASPVFAPQVAKVLAPVRLLTVEQVAAALTAAKVRGN
jgi:energy-coupling factor transport system ATP-binding protein